VEETLLARAVSRALAESAPHARELAALIDDLIRRMNTPAEAPRSFPRRGRRASRSRTGSAQPERADPAGDTDDNGTGVLLRDERLIGARVAEHLGEVADIRLASTGTFNIVLFGRTGAGKSSLITALTGEDGRRISPGRSDHTQRVTKIAWGGCHLYDTPGIGGWARQLPGQDLEEAARRAVVAADVVLLCFDDQSQQAGEFTRIAAWIADYGKPAVAVLNCRQFQWRDPLEVGRDSHRRRLSTAIAQHARHIRAELADAGLAGTPLVAIHTQRAVAARAADPYRGPYPDTVAGQRRTYGRDGLLAWSNLPALEDLLIQVIRSDAVQLRLGSLFQQVDGALRIAGEEVHRRLQEPATRQAAEIERGLERLLAILGPPGPESGGEPEEARQSLLRALAALEQARGGPLLAPPVAEARAHADNLLTSRLTGLRSAAQSRAETLVDNALRDRVTVSGDAFSQQVFPGAEVKRVDEAARKIVADFTAYVEQRVELTVGDIHADLTALAPGRTRVRGNAGHRWHRAGNWAWGGGAGLGAVSGALTLGALANFWHPGGWVLAGAAIASALGPLVGRMMRWFGSRRAEEARARGHASARKAVRDAFDDFETHIAAACDRVLGTAVLRTVAPGVDQALALRRIGTRAAGHRARITRLRAGLPPAVAPTAVLRQAVTRAERDAGITRAGTADLHWLGESWCTEPLGLAAPARTGRDRTKGAPPQFRPGGLERMVFAISRTDRVPTRGSGAQWLASVHTALDGDPEAAETLAELDGLAAAPRPRIVIAGDYSSGKSSFIRRLHIEAGLPVPDGLTIAGAPETRQARSYPWQDLLLIDTPGFQSGQAQHAEAARAAIADAAAVIYLFTIQGVVGDRADLTLLLAGDPERGIVPKADRSLFVLNQIDTLGGHPTAAPEEFTQAVRQKEAALDDALAVLVAAHPGAHRPHPSRVLSMAADPGGLEADSPAELDASRAWDGFRGFATAIRAFRLELGRNAADVTLLHGGLARLGALRAHAEDLASRLQDRVFALARLAQETQSAADTGRSLHADAIARLHRLAEDFTAKLVHAALEPQLAPEERESRAKRLTAWHDDPEFRQLLDEWADQHGRRFEDWAENVRAAHDRYVLSPAFRAAYPEPGRHVDVSFLTSPARGALRRTALQSAGTSADLIGLLDTATVVDVAAQLGVEIAQDAARRLLEDIADTGGLLRIVRSLDQFAALTAVMKADKEAPVRRALLLRAAHESARRWAAHAATRLAPLQDRRRRLDGLTGRHLADCREQKGLLDVTRQRGTTYSALMTQAQALLARPRASADTRKEQP
jgi:predicted GTPase